MIYYIFLLIQNKIYCQCISYRQGKKKKKSNLSLKQPQPDCSSQFIRKEHIIFLKCEYFEIFFFFSFLGKNQRKKKSGTIHSASYCFSENLFLV